jgi:hypothetical protein
LSYEAKKFILSIDNKLKTNGELLHLKKTAEVTNSKIHSNLDRNKNLNNLSNLRRPTAMGCPNRFNPHKSISTLLKPPLVTEYCGQAPSSPLYIREVPSSNPGAA